MLVARFQPLPKWTRKILGAELNGLLFSAADYRSRLRVVRGAAKRLETRAAKLLGEDE